MQTRGYQRLARLDVARHAFAKTALGPERDQRGIGLRLVPLLQGRLEGSKVFCPHRTLSPSLRFERTLKL